MTTATPLFSFRSHRLRIAILLMLAVFHAVVMRVNLNMAIVAMVDVRYFREFWKQSPLKREAHFDKITETIEEIGDYNGTLLWVPPMQAILFSATFWGSILTVAVTDNVIQRIGAKAALGVAITVSIAVSVVTPLLSELSFPALFAARMAMGAGESFVMPSIGAIASRWIPPSERFVMMEMITSGNQLAASFSAVVTALLCLTPLGWPAAYYFYALLATLWLAAWIALVANSPGESTIVTENEAKFIAATVPSKPKPGQTPWRSILSSRPFIACLSCQFAFVYTATIIQGFLPTFLRAELRLPLVMNGLFTLIPFGSMLIMKTVYAILAKKLNEAKVSTPAIRAKSFQALSSIGCIVSLVSIGFFTSPDQPLTAALSLVVFGASHSAAVPGFAISTQSLSPQHSVAVTKISAIVGVLAGITAPMVMFTIMTLKVNGIVDSIWRTAFAVACVLNLVAVLMFLLFGEVRDQGWQCNEKARGARVHSIEKIENGN